MEIIQSKAQNNDTHRKEEEKNNYKQQQKQQKYQPKISRPKSPQAIPNLQGDTIQINRSKI